MSAITNEVCWDVLTTAFEGGFTEEFEVVEYDRDADRGHVITRAVVKQAEGYEVDSLPLDWQETLDAATMRRGFQRFTAWIRESDPERNTYLGSQWDEAQEEGWEYLDAIGADAVLQFACFGEVVFG